jgi:hypothetical protein
MSRANPIIQGRRAPLLTQHELVEIRGMTAPRQRSRGDAQAQWYDSSRWSPNRSWIWYPVQDAKKDLDRFTRYELNKRAEALWKNSPIIRGVIKRLVTLIIGVGAFPTPKSASKEFNAELKTFLRRKFRCPCVDNKKGFGNYQRVKMTGMCKHGESFTVFVHDERTGEDKLQGFEWHRCGGTLPTSPGLPQKNKSLVYGSADAFNTKPSDATSGGDGIDFFPTGYPRQYNFTGMDQPVPENLVVHHAIIERDEQVRGETILAAAINTAHDIKDIIDLEKAAVKDASAKQDIIQTLSGDLDPESMLKLPFGAGQGNFPTPMSLPKDDSNKTAYYNTKFQGAPVVLRTGDKYTPYVPARPGSAWSGFMAYLSNLVVLTTGLPPSMVLPIDVGGTDIRRDLQIAQRVVAILQDDFAGDLQTIAEYFIQGGIEDRVFKSKVPEDWDNLEWHFTGSLTVDRNRDADRRAAVQDGLLSTDEYFGEMALDGDEQMALIVKEAKHRRFLITDIAESEPFKSAVEFKQFLNLAVTSAVSFRETSPSPDDDAGAVGEPAPGKNKNRQLQPQNA